MYFFAQLRCAVDFPFPLEAGHAIFQGMKRLAAAILLAVLPLQAADLWSTDHEASLKKAAAEKRLLLLEFTGSDWCPPCRVQAREVFDQPGFAKFAEDNLVPVKLDFPRKSSQSAETQAANQALAEKYSVEGFPTVILLDSRGTELARKVGYGGGGVEAFISWVEKNKK